MDELDRMIAETHEWRVFHREQFRRGVAGATIEAAACAIREKALLDAKRAVLAERVLKPIIAVMLLMIVGSARAGDLPDPVLTPGVTTTATLHAICTTVWGKDRRFVTAAMKAEVFRLYGLSGNDDESCPLDRSGRRFEIDHLISRELGGADDIKNLWPQCYSGKWNAVMKDRVENRLHKEVCIGNLTVEEAQTAIAADWRIPYRQFFQTQ